MRASQKILFPYLNTPGGLAQWFADDVKVDEDKIYHFFWNDEEQRAKVAVNRRDQLIRFEYLPGSVKVVGSGIAPAVPASGDGSANSSEGEEELPYVEFTLEKNEMTQSVFLKVVDCTTIGDEDEIQEIWDSMITNLREMIGG